GNEKEYFGFKADVTGDDTQGNTIHSGTIVGESSCFPIARCDEDIETKLFDICWLKEEDYQFNQTLADNSDLDPLTDIKSQLSEVLTPVWRPNTDYAIKLKTNERI